MAEDTRGLTNEFLEQENALTAVGTALRKHRRVLRHGGDIRRAAPRAERAGRPDYTATGITDHFSSTSPS